MSPMGDQLTWSAYHALFNQHQTKNLKAWCVLTIYYYIALRSKILKILVPYCRQDCLGCCSINHVAWPS